MEEGEDSPASNSPFPWGATQGDQKGKKESEMQRESMKGEAGCFLRVSPVSGNGGLCIRQACFLASPLASGLS